MVEVKAAEHTGGMKEKTFIRMVGLRVRTFRERQKLSQEELAHRAGVAVLTVSKIELGTADARIGTLSRLAKALSIPVGELLSDMDGSQPDRLHRKMVNDVAVILARQDIKTVKAFLQILETTLSLMEPKRRRT